MYPAWTLHISQHSKLLCLYPGPCLLVGNIVRVQHHPEVEIRKNHRDQGNACQEHEKDHSNKLKNILLNKTKNNKKDDKDLYYVYP